MITGERYILDQKPPGSLIDFHIHIAHNSRVHPMEPVTDQRPQEYKSSHMCLMSYTGLSHVPNTTYPPTAVTGMRSRNWCSGLSIPFMSSDSSTKLSRFPVESSTFIWTMTWPGLTLIVQCVVSPCFSPVAMTVV